VYVAGDTQFNEAFAVAVERAGLARWLQFRGREEQLERFRQSRARQLQYIALFARKRAELAQLYTGKIPQETMRERKQAIFASLEAQMSELAEQYGRSGYLNWIEDGLNNAHLASVATYFDCVPGFERLPEAQGGDMTKFYAAVKELAGKPKKERHASVCPQPQLDAGGDR
jgi:predicted aminopeptidase